MIPYRVIERKRSGEPLSSQELEGFLGGYLEGRVPDYQVSAFLMAVFFRGLDPEELDALVDVMIRSGAVLDLSGLPGPRVDKHSTGGVGDKVSLVLAPLAAELGLFVPMMSGRGLGHTGGTLDKLEAIPGFRTDPEPGRFRRILEEVGCAMTGQTEEIAPLDRRLYDLRSVTATVPSIPLIAASIMSKKLAEDLTGLVLDVKVGDGAFIPDPQGARELARTMVGIGRARGVETVARLTAMDRPLGRAVGNALETREAIECLAGAGPPDLRELVVELAAEMVRAGGSTRPAPALRAAAGEALDRGTALERFRRLVELQGGDPSVVDRPDALPAAPHRQVVRARSTGVVTRVAPRELGYGVVELGGGRKRLGDAVDPAVGFVLAVTPGQRVDAGDPLGEVHARRPEDLPAGAAILEGAVEVGDGEPRLLPLLGERIGPEE